MSDPIVQETHQIAAGSQFDGQAPSTDSDLKLGDLVYAPDAQGGGFLLPTGLSETTKAVIPATTSKRVRRVLGLRVAFGGQTSWSLVIVDSEANETTWLSGTTETSLVVTDEQLELAPNDWLKLVTVGASTAMVAAVAFDTPRKATR